MKPRCTTECCEDIKSLEAEKGRLIHALVAANQKVIDVSRDRDEWKTQHENLLAIYQASLALT